MGDSSTVRPDHALPPDVIESLRLGAEPCSIDELIRKMLSPDGTAHVAVHRYVCFMKTMTELFRAIAECYDARSPQGSFGRKEHLRHTDPIEMALIIANQLYVLDAHGVLGCLLECGVSHGFSTCCLSHACAYLDRTLIAADSFEGLPEPTTEEEFFARGDYAATVEWLDVDLYESARDVLGHVYGSLVPGGVIFTHEFTDFFNRPFARGEPKVPNAIFETCEERGHPHRSEYLLRYFGMVGREGSRGQDAPRLRSRSSRPSQNGTIAGGNTKGCSSLARCAGRLDSNGSCHAAGGLSRAQSGLLSPIRGRGGDGQCRVSV